jgi:hypothetical protein
MVNEDLPCAFPGFHWYTHARASPGTAPPCRGQRSAEGLACQFGSAKAAATIRSTPVGSYAAVGRHPSVKLESTPDVHTVMRVACQSPEGVSSPLPCDGALYGTAPRDYTDSGPNAGGGARRFEAAS